GHPPYAALVYVYSEIFEETHASVAGRTDRPLRVLLDEIGTLLHPTEWADATVRKCLQEYTRVLSQRLADNLSDPKYSAELSAYSSLSERVAADLSLSDFESDELASDINNWRDRV